MCVQSMYFQQIGQGTKRPVFLREMGLQGFWKNDLSVWILKIFEKTKNDPCESQSGAVERVNKFELFGRGVPIADIHPPRLKICEEAAA